MNGIEILTDAATRPRDAATGLVDGLPREMLNVHPAGHDNSIAWLLWHSAREMDVQISALSGEEPVWTAQGFDERFGLNLSEQDIGLGHSPDQARSIRADDPQLLLDHLSAVTEALLDYLHTLDDDDLGEVIDPDWDPPVRRGQRIVSLIDDAAQHIAQAAYVAGMDRDRIAE